MEITKTRTLKINMGNWEHDEAFFRVTINTDDLLLAGHDLANTAVTSVADMLINIADRKIQEQVDAHLEQCRSLSANEDSFCFVVPPANQPPAEATPAKAKKRIRRP